MPLFPDKNTYSPSHTHTSRYQHERSQSPCSASVEHSVSLGLSPLSSGHSRIKIAMQRLTKQPKQALDKLEQSCDSWSSSTLPRTYVNNTDDFKEYKCGIAAVDKSYSPGCCAYFPSNSIMHNRDNTDLGLQTSCAETRLSLGCNCCC